MNQSTENRLAEAHSTGFGYLKLHKGMLVRILLRNGAVPIYPDPPQVPDYPLADMVLSVRETGGVFEGVIADMAVYQRLDSSLWEYGIELTDHTVLAVGEIEALEVIA